MITKKDYLKSFKRMNENEQLDYLSRVERWTEETYPRLAALTDAWTDTDIKDYDDGLRLATALQKAQGFIATHQRYDAKRRLEVLNKLLREVRLKSDLGKTPWRLSTDTRRYMAVVPAPAKVDEDGKPVAKPQAKAEEVAGRRPDQLKEYIHLLPKELQDEAKGVDDMYLRLAMLRNQLELLAANPNANQSMTSLAAKKVVAQEKKILNLWQRVDLAYNKATGHQIDEDELKKLGKEAADMEKKPTSEYTFADIEAMPDGDEKETLKRARIEADKKYLRRSDSQMTDERKAQIAQRVTELLAWGQSISERAREVCAKHGIDVPGLNPEPKAQPKEEPKEETTEEPTEEITEEQQPQEEPKEEEQPKEELLQPDLFTPQKTNS